MSTNDRIALDVAVATARIGVLLRTYPELAEDEALLADALEGQTDLHPVMSKLVRIRQEKRHAAASLSSYMDDLNDRKARMMRGADAVTALMKGLMDTAGAEKLVLPEATVSISSARESVVITDEEAVPSQLCKLIRQPDKKAIGDALKAGESIPGAALQFGESTLTIRTK